MSVTEALDITLKVASEAPATKSEAWEGLERLAKALRDHLKVDRAKIYLVRRSPGGPLIWRVSTDGQGESRRVAYSPDNGLADWVIRNNSFLLIPSPKKRKSSDVDRLRQRGLDQLGEWIEVEARPEEEMSGEWPGSVASDNECTLLYMPVSTDQRVSAVVGISRDWRDGGTPAKSLEIDDVSTLESVAPAVATACQRLLHLEMADEQLDVTHKLAATLAQAKNLASGYDAVAQSVGTLAGCAAAILLEDRSEGGLLFETGSWSSIEDRVRRTPLLLACGEKKHLWERRVRATLERNLPELRLRKLLISTARPLESRRAIAICDKALDFQEPPYFSDRLLERYIEIFFEAACGSLDGLITQLGNRLIDGLTGPPDDASRAVEAITEHPATDLLTTAAKLLRRAVGAGAVLVYGGDEQARVLASVPESELDALPEVEAKSRTAEALRSGEGHWAVDIHEDPKVLDHSLITRLENALDWSEGIGSWQVVPVLHGGRTVGLLKLLTKHGERLLGGDHYRLAKTVARQAAWEVRRELRRSALERLNTALNKIGAAEGRELGGRLVQALRSWARETLIRPECEVILFARSLRSGTLAEASTLELELAEIPRDHEALEAPLRWIRHQKRLPFKTPLQRPGISVPIRISGDRRLQGFVAIVDRSQPGASETEVLAEAARFLAVFLQAERERNDVRLDMGLFRHAALGAIQGLTSNALLLAEIATEAGWPESEVGVFRRRIDYEAAQLRLWRENQRFYLSSSRSELRRFRQPLRPILENCFERYRAAAELREAQYSIDLPREGSISAVIDKDAIDIAVSNLLDNAVKYAFNRREVTLGLWVVRSEVQIWVEDVGHGIPEEFRQRIFDRSARRVGPDPFRSIAGQGLGLHLVKKIIDLHDGEITVSSELEDVSDRPERTPHRVRFTLHLPF